jgi:DNA-binding NarL/FixJ family response regulator
MTVRLFLIDDHPLFRAGVCQAVADSCDIQVVGESYAGDDVIRLLRDPELCPDVVLMGIQPPACPGIGVIESITARNGQEANHAPRVLVVSASAADDAIVAALRAGAHGYLLKSASQEELLRAIRTVADGGAAFGLPVACRLREYFSAVHAAPVRAAFPQLTEREREILDLLARGHGNRQIARQLVLAEKTIRNHITHVFMKLEVTDRASAIVRAREAGLGKNL